MRTTYRPVRSINSLAGKAGFAKRALSLAVLSASVSSVGVLAQSNLALEEIIVTATKKDEVLQDVASTVNVMTGVQLEQFNVFQFEDVQKMTPGLALENFSTRVSGISLRGAPFDPDSSAAATVVTYVNGVAVRPNVAFNQLFDIERIEILRGAQGTLQGEASPSGSIQIYTKRAESSVFNGMVRQTFDDNDGAVTEAAVNIPVIKNVLGARISAVTSKQEFWGLNSEPLNQEASTQTNAGRLSLAFTPTDDLTANFSYQYLDRIADSLTAIEGTSSFDGNSYDAQSRTSLQEDMGEIVNRNEIATLEINYQLGDFGLTWVSGYQDNLASSVIDLDTGNIIRGSLSVLGPVVTPGYALEQRVASNYEEWTHEFRIANDSDDFWNYLFGVYYSKTVTHTDVSTQNAQILSPDFYTGSPGQFLLENFYGDGTGYFGLLNVGTTVPTFSETFAIFTNHTFYLTERGKLDVGLRWSEFDTTINTTNVALTDTYFDPGNPLIVQPAGSPLGSSEGESGAQPLTGSIKYGYELNPEITVYASYSKGYRQGGGIVEPTVGIDPALTNYDEEESDSYELGFKSVLDDGRYQVNGAIYYQAFDGFIFRFANENLDINGDGFLDTTGSGINVNADTIVRGAELEATALLSENWRLFSALSYNDTKLDGASLPCGDIGDAADPGSQIRTCSSDGRIGNAPNWSATVSSEYTIPMGSLLDGEAYVRGLYKFTGHSSDDFASVNPAIYPNGWALPSYGVWDLYLGLRSYNETWDINIWAKNLFDKEAVNRPGGELSLAPASPGVVLSGVSTVSVIPSQTIGITATYRFGSF